MDKKIPITPSDIIRRMKDVPEILKWSRKKHLIVSGPEFWGIHHIYINNSLKHTIFCLKTDLTTHVFIGIPTGAKEWRKYDKDANLLLSKQLNDDFLEWKIYKDIVLYKGKILPPKEIPEEPYWGEVMEVETFNDDVNDQWIVSKTKELYNKIKVSKKQFAGLLDYWLWGFLSEKTVKKNAKDLGFKIINNEDFSKIFEELFILDMWLVIYTCEGIFEDENKRNDILDIFHHLEYGRYFEKEKKSFSDWMMSITPRYVEYNKAMETEHPSTPLWVLAKIINKRLFGEIKKGLRFQAKMITYIGLFVEHLGKVIKQYDIE